MTFRLALAAAHLSRSHLYTLNVLAPPASPPSSVDAPLPKVQIRKVKMAKAAMRDARRISLAEILPTSTMEDTKTNGKKAAGGKAEQDQVDLDREDAWVRVCLRESIGRWPTSL
jgi:hypothetical protein